MNDARDRIASVKAYCAIDETWHQFAAPYFAYCSGDGVVGSLAGAPFRMGVEARSEFGEPMGPNKPTSDTMGLSLHMHARDAGRPMPFTRPQWVRLELNAEDFGPYRPVCEHFFPDTGGFWWLEWGGACDTVHDSTSIKEEVPRITLAVSDYLENRSSLAEKLTTYQLDWMGAIPGKRESRPLRGRSHSDDERHRPASRLRGCGGLRRLGVRSTPARRISRQGEPQHGTNTCAGRTTSRSARSTREPSSTFSSPDETSVPPTTPSPPPASSNTAYVLEEECSGCKSCIPLCPYTAITFDTARQNATINEALCKGCGTCVASCPSGSIVQNLFEDDEIFSEIGGVLAEVPV